MAKKPKRLLGKARPLSEKSALILFVQAWERSQSCIPSELAEKNAIAAVVNKCKRRLNKIADEEKRNSIEAKAVLKEYEEKRKAEIDAGHKKTRFSSWLKKLPGSALTPKK